MILLENDLNPIVFVVVEVLVYANRKFLLYFTLFDREIPLYWILYAHDSCVMLIVHYVHCSGNRHAISSNLRLIQWLRAV